MNSDRSTTAALARFRRLENQWMVERGWVTTRYADIFAEAIANGATFERKFKTPGHPGSAAYGVVYVAESSSRLGMVKLGAHGSEELSGLRKRLSLFARLYQLEPMSLAYGTRVEKPFEVELLVKAEWRAFWVNTNRKGESNEWYKISATSAVRRLQLVLKSHGIEGERLHLE